MTDVTVLKQLKRYLADMKIRGRQKLTEFDVRTIREQYSAGIQTHVLAKRYGVAGNTVRRIVNGKGWKHID